MSNRPNPIRPVGSNVTLTCIIKLNPVVDIAVDVTTVWTKPDETVVITYTTTQFDNENHINFYTTNVTIESFVNIDSGNYLCTATVLAETMSSQYVNESGAVAANKARVTTGA